MSMAGCVLTCGLTRCRCREHPAGGGQRLDRLAESTREVLVAAAVSGRVFASELVGEVAGADGNELIIVFDEAERARLIVPGKSLVS